MRWLEQPERAHKSDVVKLGVDTVPQKLTHLEHATGESKEDQSSGHPWLQVSLRPGSDIRAQFQNTAPPHLYLKRADKV